MSTNSLILFPLGGVAEWFGSLFWAGLSESLLMNGS